MFTKSNIGLYNEIFYPRFLDIISQNENASEIIDNFINNMLLSDLQNAGYLIEKTNYNLSVIEKVKYISQKLTKVYLKYFNMYLDQDLSKISIVFKINFIYPYGSVNKIGIPYRDFSFIIQNLSFDDNKKTLFSIYKDNIIKLDISTDDKNIVDEIQRVLLNNMVYSNIHVGIESIEILKKTYPNEHSVSLDIITEILHIFI
jgi:hypothetical protein